MRCDVGDIPIGTGAIVGLVACLRTADTRPEQ